MFGKHHENDVVRGNIVQERIAVVFDFDDTLGPDSTTGFLKQAGIKDIDTFWKEVGDMMVESL